MDWMELAGLYSDKHDDDEFVGVIVDDRIHGDI